VTYNKINTYAWFKDNVANLSPEEGYDPTNRTQAFAALTTPGKIPLGILYREERETFEDLALRDRPTPIVDTPLDDLTSLAKLQEVYR
jgi:2-oxoglutarate ferredoxin oxidoreductase subunit beta